MDHFQVGFPDPPRSQLASRSYFGRSGRVAAAKSLGHQMVTSYYVAMAGKSPMFCGKFI